MNPSVPSTRVLKVFLASPRDLSHERTEVKAAVDYANTLLEKRLRWKIELYGWEDAPPTFGRPQERINKEVDECHLFIGMLWKRWGEPSEGGYSSGFEEEFERAVQRRKGSDSPEIWLFLKDIEEADLADPGEQLQRVLTFREVQRSTKELFYKPFRNTETFRDLIREFLPQHLLEIAFQFSDIAAPSHVPDTSEAVPNRNPGAKASSSGDYRGQIARLS